MKESSSYIHSFDHKLNNVIPIALVLQVCEEDDAVRWLVSIKVDPGWSESAKPGQTIVVHMYLETDPVRRKVVAQGKRSTDDHSFTVIAPESNDDGYEYYYNATLQAIALYKQER